jgi:hypothetical protein
MAFGAGSLGVNGGGDLLQAKLIASTAAKPAAFNVNLTIFPSWLVARKFRTTPLDLCTSHPLASAPE